MAQDLYFNTVGYRGSHYDSGKFWNDNFNKRFLSDSTNVKAQFRCRTLQEPNLIHWIKYKKSSASERIRNVYFNLERLTHSSRLAWPGISTLDRLGTALIKMPNFCKQFDRNEHFPPFKLSSAAIKIGVWITSAILINLGWPSFELGSLHEKVSVWTGPNFTFAPMWYRTLEYLVMNVCTLRR